MSNGVGLHLLLDLVCSLTTVASGLSIHLQFNQSYDDVICKPVAGCVPLVQNTNGQLVEKVVPLPQEIDFFFVTGFPADFNLPEGLAYKILNGFVALHDKAERWKLTRSVTDQRLTCNQLTNLKDIINKFGK